MKAIYHWWLRRKARRIRAKLEVLLDRLDDHQAKRCFGWGVYKCTCEKTLFPVLRKTVAEGTAVLVKLPGRVPAAKVVAK